MDKEKAIEITKEIVIAAISSPNPITTSYTAEGIGEYFQTVYEKLVSLE